MSRSKAGPGWVLASLPPAAPQPLRLPEHGGALPVQALSAGRGTRIAVPRGRVCHVEKAAVLQPGHVSQPGCTDALGMRVCLFVHDVLSVRSA